MEEAQEAQEGSSYEPEARPIVIAIDESGSMTTSYGGMTGEVWSRSVMLIEEKIALPHS